MSTSWKTNYEQAVKEYFDIPSDAEIDIYDDCYYTEGCPTCGGDYEFTVSVQYNVEKTKTNPYGYKSHTYNGKMTEFLADLPR